MPKKLHIDIETFSSINLKESGAYRYMESIDFEILMVAYAFDDEEVQIVDLAQGESLPDDFLEGLKNPEILKCAHNATFERNAFKVYGYDIPVEQWECTSIKAAYCGLPLSLEMVSKALKFGDQGKDSKGKSLIQFFSIPIKPTKKNNGKTRNFYYDDPKKWGEFKQYCIQDVVVERHIDDTLSGYKIPKFETNLYRLDQKINDKGIEVDINLAKNAASFDRRFSKEVKDYVRDLTGVENPNSPAQLKRWLSDQLQEEVNTLAKEHVEALLKKVEPGPIREVLLARQKLGKTSTKKYLAMINCQGESKRIRGLFQFYGANRTGRWAGRLVQVQNLPQNHLKDLEEARQIVASGDYGLANILYDNVPKILSELIRTAFVAKEGHTFAVADFSAIEARVLSWLAGESWREEVFRTHGKIYEASAAMMYGVPIESIDKGSDLRQRGKTAELALGYQGAVGAMKQMDKGKSGLTEKDMKSIVHKWRKANPSIVQLWYNVDKCAQRAVKTRKRIISKFKNLEFKYDGTALTVRLPSGKKLYYWEPTFKLNKFGNQALAYRGVDQNTKRWVHIETYGGKLVENIVQAISRDLLAYSMLKLDREGLDIVMHVHDEAAVETPIEQAETTLKRMCDIMGEDIPWAEGLPLNADGYITPFYKKD